MSREKSQIGLPRRRRPWCESECRDVDVQGAHRLTISLRLDWIILPPLVLAFFALQLDRGNM